MWYNDEVTQAILHKKYLHEGEKTFDDLVNRVSSIYSEDIREDVKEAMYNADLCPAGRTLYAAGMKGKQRLTASNCFLETTQVLTIEGYKNIKDIIIGDNIITETGIHSVEAISKRKYTGNVIKIHSKTLLNDIICTPNHKFLTKDGWKTAEQILNDGKIKIQYLKYNNGIDIRKYKQYDTIDLINTPLGKDMRIEQINNEFLIYKKYVNDRGKMVWSTRGNKLKRFIPCNPDFMYFLGRWIGDGSVTKRKDADYYSIVQIVFNATTEKEAADRIIKIGTELFGIVPSVRITEQNVIAVRFESPILGQFFEQNFGHGCEGKHLPDKFLGNYDILFGILDSDGAITSSSAIQLVMKNKSLMEWVYKTLHICGIHASKIRPNKKYDHTWNLLISSSFASNLLIPYMTKKYNDSRMINKYMYALLFNYARILDVVEETVQDVYVYNLQIKDDHTYNVEGVVVHNCFILGNIKEDTLESISETDYEISRIGSAGGGIGFAVDNIRPKGSKINNAAQVSDGVAFAMRKINQTGQIVGQQHRGLALMCAISCNHPDILEFLNIKKKHEALESMNISIKFTDEFMQAVVDNKDYELYFKVESTGEEIRKTINARKFFEEFCKVAWDTGDPKHSWGL